LSDLENESSDIDRLTLEKFVTNAAERHGIALMDGEHGSITKEVIDELNKFGARKIIDVSRLITEEFVEQYKKVSRKNTSMGFLRDLMLFKDIDKYFSGPMDWTRLNKEDAEFLFRKWGEKRVTELLARHYVKIEGDDDFGLQERNEVEF
jgi:hypothetical protein